MVGVTVDTLLAPADVSSQMPLEVVLSKSASECSDLYRSIGVFIYSRGPQYNRILGFGRALTISQRASVIPA